MSERVAILGASDNPARYAFRALELLTRHGHEVVLVNPQLTTVAGRPCVARLEDIVGDIDTITVYLRSALSEPLADSILAVKPSRVIFNPGSESPMLKRTLEAAGIRVQWDCTLVLLNSGCFEA